ncbi:two-component system sensor histidine kinase NtrB [Neorhodopirellula pilleata]|uniref:Sensor protein FixL n=1 Tax=Neorhodopirellula pilleata TaxID=2714738 RepID=A0A5C6AQV8_9BACT|nr:PAS domain S-box protein [Neorhodopirellula pilleata]TWU01877.1 Sensor protein FixL [Neorhodopirellula pilleata]
MTYQHEAVLAAVLNTAVDAIIIMDASGIIRAANVSTERMFGYRLDEIIGHNIRMLMPSPYRENHDGYLAKYREHGQRNIIGIGREVSGQKKDATAFPLHLAVSEIQHEGETLFTGILRDITDLKAVQDQLARSNEVLEANVQERTAQLEQAQAELVQKEKLATLGQIAGGIAHEIRNPLNTVKTSVYYIQHAKKLTPEKLTEHLERIDRQVTVLDNVVTALADVARLPTPQREACDLSELIAQTLDSVSFPAHLTIDNQLNQARATGDLLQACVDGRQLPIVFRNLFRNARDAMSDQADKISTLTIRGGRVEPDRVWITVSDNGTGIAGEHLAKITDPFFSTKARGMGLGLAITKAIIEKNDGQISVTSELGEGTTFRIEFPAYGPPSPEKTVPRQD